MNTYAQLWHTQKNAKVGAINLKNECMRMRYKSAIFINKAKLLLKLDMC